MRGPFVHAGAGCVVFCESRRARSHGVAPPRDPSRGTAFALPPDIMKNHGPKGAGPNQGEGDRASSRQYNRHLQEFMAAGKVDRAARGAKKFVENEPEAAAAAEAEAKAGPHGGTKVSIDELVAKGRSVIDRVAQAAKRLRSKLSSKDGK